MILAMIDEIYRHIRYLYPYTFKYWFLQKYHHYFYWKHKWTWSKGVFECGCCGYEGAQCKICHKRILIGEVGSSWPIIESGDFLDYDY